MNKAVEAYLHQITEGCGCSNCTCPHCASSKLFKIINLKPEEIATAIESGKIKLCPSICPVLYDEQFHKMNVEFSSFITSNTLTSKFQKIMQFIDTKNKFCSLFWGNAKYSKRDYNIDEKKLCIFFKNLKQMKLDATKENNHQKFDEIVSMIDKRIDDICSSEYSYFTLRGVIVFFGFSSLLTQDQFLVEFSKLSKYFKKGCISLIHDIYYVISKYPMIIGTSVDFCQTVLTSLCTNYGLENETLINSLVKHISNLSQANDISNEPVSYLKFQNEAFTRLLNAQQEVLKMIRGEFSYISKSSLLTLPFKKAIADVESQILMFLNSDENESEFKIEIKRNRLLEDTLSQIHKAGEKEILRPLEVEFYREDATDQGGVSKEYFSLTSKLLFDSNHFDKYDNFYFFKANYDFLDPSTKNEFKLNEDNDAKNKINDDNDSKDTTTTNNDSNNNNNSNNNDDDDDDANDENDSKNNNLKQVHSSKIAHSNSTKKKNKELTDREYYKLCGRFAGIAVHNSITLPIRFPLLLYKMLRKLVIKLDDLEEIKPEVINSLKCLLDMKDSCTDQDFDDLDLYFTISVYDEKSKDVKTLPLIINGENIKVNRTNVQFYVQEMKKTIIKSYLSAFKAFKKGFWEALGSKTCKQFFNEELDVLVSGSYVYDWNNFMKGTVYSSGYNEKSETVQMFWDVFNNDFSEDQRKQFLFFVTGSKNVPVDGLSGIKFEIHRSGDTSLLPVAHTCFNLLQLPDYQNVSELRKNLLICLDNSEGFGVL